MLNENITKGNWSNPKWDKALLTMMKKHPENITMCPNCGHFTIDKKCGTTRQFVRFHLSHGHVINCAVCGMSLSGKKYVKYTTGASEALADFFKEANGISYTLDDIRRYVLKSHRLTYLPRRNTPFTFE